MASKAEFLQLHRDHPDWTARQLADAMGCMPEYVNATARRCNATLHRINCGASARLRQHRALILALGREAFRVGFSVDDLQAMARAKRPTEAPVIYYEGREATR